MISCAQVTVHVYMWPRWSKNVGFFDFPISLLKGDERDVSINYETKRTRAVVGSERRNPKGTAIDHITYDVYVLRITKRLFHKKDFF